MAPAMEISFETLKVRAKKQLARNLGADPDPHGFIYFTGYHNQPGHCDTLAALSIDEGFRRQVADVMRERHPHVPLRAVNLANTAMAILFEEANRMIDLWDVRMVRGLVRAFPEIVAAKYRNKPITCYIEDSDDAPWVVAFAEAERN